MKNLRDKERTLYIALVQLLSSSKFEESSFLVAPGTLQTLVTESIKNALNKTVYKAAASRWSGEPHQGGIVLRDLRIPP